MFIQNALSLFSLFSMGFLACVHSCPPLLRGKFGERINKVTFFFYGANLLPARTRHHFGAHNFWREFPVASFEEDLEAQNTSRCSVTERKIKVPFVSANFECKKRVSTFCNSNKKTEAKQNFIQNFGQTIKLRCLIKVPMQTYIS